MERILSKGLALFNNNRYTQAKRLFERVTHLGQIAYEHRTIAHYMLAVIHARAAEALYNDQLGILGVDLNRRYSDPCADAGVQLLHLGDTQFNPEQRALPLLAASTLTRIALTNPKVVIVILHNAHLRQRLNAANLRLIEEFYPELPTQQELRDAASMRDEARVIASRERCEELPLFAGLLATAASGLMAPIGQ